MRPVPLQSTDTAPELLDTSTNVLKSLGQPLQEVAEDNDHDGDYYASNKDEPARVQQLPANETSPPNPATQKIQTDYTTISRAPSALSTEMSASLPPRPEFLKKQQEQVIEDQQQQQQQ